MTRYRCLELKLHTSIVDSALCGLRNDKYIFYGITSISNNLPQNNLVSQLQERTPPDPSNRHHRSILNLYVQFAVAVQLIQVYYRVFNRLIFTQFGFLKLMKTSRFPINTRKAPFLLTFPKLQGGKNAPWSPCLIQRQSKSNHHGF